MPTHTTTLHPTPHALLRHAGAYLMGDPVANGLLLGILHGIGGGEYVRPPLLAAVEDGDGAVDMVAVRTPPWQIVLSRGSDASVAALVERLIEEKVETPGVHGPEETAGPFATLWAERHGMIATVRQNLRLYTLDTLRPPDDVPGAMRPAAVDDGDLYLEWIDRFSDDAGVAAPAETRHERAMIMLRDGRIVLWTVDDQPVSMAGWIATPPNGARVGYVYTPPERRRNGYASAVTAALSAQLRRRGIDPCMLFTDLANPTSNDIYQRIGYRAVGDVVEYAFGESDS